MNKFTMVIESYLSEAAMPPPAPAAGMGGVPGGAAPGGMPAPGGDIGGGDMGGGGSALPGMGGGPEAGAEGQPGADVGGMDNATKKKTDPMAYTEAMLKLLVSDDAGITPEMFNDFLDTFGTGLSKIRDQEGFKRFYGDLYKKIKDVMEIKESLKSVYNQLHGTLKDVVATQKEEPNTAGGGEGMAGPSGPGVQ